MAATDPIEKTPSDAQKKARLAQRKARLEKLEQANRITFALQGDVRRFIAGQARKEGMDIGHFLQKLVENHVLATAPEDSPLSTRIAARRGVIDAAVARAKEMDAAGKFDARFIFNVMKSLSEESEFSDMYNKAIGVEPSQAKRVARERAALNRQLGRVIKRAAGARSQRDEKNRIQRAQVQGEIIASFTLLDKPA